MGIILRKCQIIGCSNERSDRTWYDDDYCPMTNSFRCDSCEEKDADNGPQDIHYYNREYRKQAAITEEIVRKLDREEPDWRTKYSVQKDKYK